MSRCPRILAVDVCGTLYDANTTAGLVIFHHARLANRWRHSAIDFITNHKSPLRAGLVVISKLTGYDFHRALVLLSLRGEHPAALNASAQRYVEDHLPKQAIQPIHTRLDRMRAAGWEPVLVSNAIEPVVSQIAGHLDLPCIASRLRLRDGRLTGRLAYDLTGRKRRALETFLNRSLSDTDFAVITDNRSDRDLVSAADPAMLVAKGKPRKWMKGFDAEILRT